MEEESFDDEEIARYLNEHYIVIKVDREVRPDLDAIYMSAVQMFMQGRGGWPMTLWLTPDGEPFSGATYLPARDGDRGAAVGFLTIAQRLKAAYDEQPDQIVAVSAEVAARVRDLLAPGAGTGRVANRAVAACDRRVLPGRLRSDTWRSDWADEVSEQSVGSHAAPAPPEDR